MRVDVKLNRCVCIHSMSQIVDTTVQLLLYQRQMIPETVESLMSQADNGDQKVDKFRLTYTDVKRVVRQSFRQRNSCHLKEFVILIGNSPHMPKEIYRIPLEICAHPEDDSATTSMNTCDVSDESADDSTTASQFNISNATPSGDCGSHCNFLTKREKLQIFTSLMLDENVQNLLENSAIANNDKVFFFVSSMSSPSLFNVDGLEEDDGFGIPDITVRRRRKIRQVIIRVRCGKSIGAEFTTTRKRKREVEPVEDDDDEIPPSKQASHTSDDESEISNMEDEKQPGLRSENGRIWFRVLQYFNRLQ